MSRLPLLAALLGVTAMAKTVTRTIDYTVGDTPFQGVLVYVEGATGRPGLVMVPNWLGINEANVKQAKLVAERGYTVLVADMYGTAVRPKSGQEAGKASGAVKADRGVMRARVNKALEVLLAQKDAPVPDGKVGAIGFCFGGTSALELARSGAAVKGTVSFHGGLSSPTPQDAKNIVGKVLVLHGAEDPGVPPPEVMAFQDEMRGGKVDWQLVAFGNTVHSFTDPDANTPGRNQYNPVVAQRAYQMMDSFFSEVFAAGR